MSNSPKRRRGARGMSTSERKDATARGAHMTRSSLLVMGAFILSKVVGLLRERAISHRFGVSPEYEAYLAAFRVPDLLFTLIAGGALVTAFLPVFAAALTDDDDDGPWRLASAVTNLALVATAVLAAAAAIAAPNIAPIIAPGFTPEQHALTVTLMRIILGSTVIFAASGIQMGMLNAFQHFLTPAIAPIVYNGGILFGALYLAPTFGIYGLAWGVVLGALGHLVVKVPSLLRRGFRWHPILSVGDPGVRRVLWLMWPRILSLGTVQAVLLVNIRLASQIESGALAALNYAWVIAQMPQTILGTAIATVAFPTLAELAARGDRAALRDTAGTALRVMISLTVPTAIALWALAGPVIAVLLLTGRFDVDAAEATRVALQMYALGLIGHVTFEVVARMFYAQQDTLTPLFIGVAAMVVNIVLAYALVGPLAQAGLALANSIAITLELVIALMILHRRLGRLGGRALWATAWRAGLAGVIMLAGMMLVLARLPVTLGVPGGAFGDGLARLVIGGLVGGASYLLIAWMVNLEAIRIARSLARLMMRSSIGFLARVFRRDRDGDGSGA